MGVDGLKHLVAELAQHSYFRDEFGVSIYLIYYYIFIDIISVIITCFHFNFQTYVPATPQDMVVVQKIQLQGTPVFKINMKTNPIESVYFGIPTIENLLRKHEWIDNIVEAKHPSNIQKVWQSLVVNIANNKSHIPSEGSNMLNIVDEMRCNFNELLAMDIANCVPAVFAEEE